MKYIGKHEMRKKPIISNEGLFALMIVLCIVCVIAITTIQCVCVLAVEEPEPVVETPVIALPEQSTKDDPMLFLKGQMSHEGLDDDEFVEPVPTPEITPEPTPKPSETYPEDCIMAISNMVYGEIGGVIYDVNMSEYEKDLTLQRWAKVALNHIAAGFAPDAVSLMSKMSGRYYIWAPQYGSTSYRDYAMRADPSRYNRCVENVKRAIDGEMYEEMPDNVIYAAGFTQGSGVYKTYNINTGWFRSTVYLCYR